MATVEQQLQTALAENNKLKAKLKSQRSGKPEDLRAQIEDLQARLDTAQQYNRNLTDTVAELNLRLADCVEPAQSSALVAALRAEREYRDRLYKGLEAALHKGRSGQHLDIACAALRHERVRRALAQGCRVRYKLLGRWYYVTPGAKLDFLDKVTYEVLDKYDPSQPVE